MVCLNRDEDYLEDDEIIEEDPETLEEEENSEDDESSSENENESEEVQDEADETPSEEAPSGIGSSLGGLKWTTLKNVISKKYFIPIALIFGLFVFILVIVALSYGGIGGGFDYIAPKCNQVRVTFGSGEDAITQNLSIEEYIISQVYSATKDLKDIDADLYRVLAIVFNTEIQSQGSCSKTFISEVDDIYQFEILNSESDEYLQIYKDINSVRDVAMVKKKTDQFYSTGVDGFCSYSSDMSGQFDIADPSNATSYTIPQLNYNFPTTWVEENVSNWNFKNCPCNDSNNASPDCFLEEWNYPEDEEPDLIYVDGGTGTGVSIYAAHYLTSHDNKTYEGVLKLFYPDKDWELKSSDPSMAPKKLFAQQCTGSNVPFNSTPLSRSEFISLVTEFLTTGSYASYAQYFIDYAGDIYDMGKDKNINPELIYIFARKETGFTSNISDTQHYNYYGMGHCNTCSHGTFYNSFMEGVEALFDYFVNKGSLEAVVKVYSYLGNYLANPGNSGDGGCYYLTLPEIYGPNYSRCNSSYRCASSGGGAGCVLTTDEEKQAYIDWQAKKYIQHRQAIFKLGKENCVSSDGMFGNTDGTKFLNKTISQFLQEQGSSLEEFNEPILRRGCQNLGTGQGVAFTAATAVSQLAGYGYKFHYVWGGNHSVSHFAYGVPATWGPGGCQYCDKGPDCSGFVSWALYNAGFNLSIKVATEWGNSGIIVDLGDERLQVGDFIVTPGTPKKGDPTPVWSHIVIITNINLAEGYYDVVEAQQTSVGVVFSKVPMAPEKRKGVLMSNYYATAAKSDAFANMCREKGYLG